MFYHHWLDMFTCLCVALFLKIICYSAGLTSFGTIIMQSLMTVIRKSFLQHACELMNLSLCKCIVLYVLFSFIKVCHSFLIHLHASFGYKSILQCGMQREWSNYINGSVYSNVLDLQILHDSSIAELGENNGLS